MFSLKKQKQTICSAYSRYIKKQNYTLVNRSLSRLSVGFRLSCVAMMFHLGASSLSAQNDLSAIVRSYIRSYKLQGYQPRDIMLLDSLRADDSLHEIYIYANEPFCSQPFTPQNVC